MAKKSGTRRGTARRERFASVAQMVRETSDRAFAEAFARRLQERRIVKDLMALRAARGLSQEDVAAQLDCTQSRISKLESASDADLRLGDFARYADVLGLRLRVVLEPKRTTAVERVKHHALQIRRELDDLARLARKDHGIAQGVSGFFGEAMFNLTKMLQDSARKLPEEAQEAPGISIEVYRGDEVEEAEDLEPRRTTRKEEELAGRS